MNFFNGDVLHFLANSLSLLILLYAEIHYSFKGIYSRLKMREPEILADLPHRIDNSAPLPVLLLIKDADRYPVILHSVEVEFLGKATGLTVQFHFQQLTVSEKLWHRVLHVEINQKAYGNCQVDVTIHCTIDNKPRTIKNDNYVSTGKKPFHVFISEEKLPAPQNWYYGDFHCHTRYTSDQVEFGAPMAAMIQLSKSLGLSFFCATDHSYDLDDEPDNFLKRDPRLTKWKNLQLEIAALNSAHPQFVIVPGEEVSAGNRRNQNIHCLILNNSEFLPGAGDSAEKWLRTKPDLSVAEILSRVQIDAVCFAAHPGTQPPFLQKWLVRRGIWQFEDLLHPNLHGLQIWNGTEEGLQKGKEWWVKLLLQGKRIYISGGTDAHGNFNRFRQIGFPFFTMRENHQHLFGSVRSCVYVRGSLSLNSLLQGIKNGRMIVTNGPFADILLKNEENENVGMGESLHGQEFRVNINCETTSEFGALDELKVFLGDLQQKQEYLIKTVKMFDGQNRFDLQFPIARKGFSGYIRVELFSKKLDKTFQCLTNPVWMNTKHS
ncbi:MAG: CehA/McbA family metallohydrolase [bacterium]